MVSNAPKSGLPSRPLPASGTVASARPAPRSSGPMPAAKPVAPSKPLPASATFKASVPSSKRPPPLPAAYDSTYPVSRIPGPASKAASGGPQAPRALQVPRPMRRSLPPPLPAARLAPPRPTASVGPASVAPVTTRSVTSETPRSTRPSKPEEAVERWQDLSPELWEVQLDAGAPKLMTLDELDAAFKEDRVTTYTFVRRPGTALWKTLGEIAGIEPSAPQADSVSLAPVASDIELPEIPRPPPVPGTAAARSRAYQQAPLSPAELAALRPRKLRQALFTAGGIALLGACVFFGVSRFLAGTFADEATAAMATELPEAESFDLVPELVKPAIPPSALTTPNPAPAPTLVVAADPVVITAPKAHVRMRAATPLPAALHGREAAAAKKPAAKPKAKGR